MCEDKSLYEILKIIKSYTEAAMKITHKYYATYRGIPAYFYTDDNTVEGRTYCNDLMIAFVMHIEDFVYCVRGLIDPEYKAEFIIKLKGKVK